MKKKIELGIGFCTGRPNVCKIINSYYQDILEQVSKYHKEVNVTFFILYDLGYQYANRVDFYGILPEVYKNINIKYITPEDIEEEKKRLTSRYDFTEKEVSHILGHGHAKGRNTIMYCASKWGMDYLLFWDDDEYPVACYKDENNELVWKKQDNVLKHLNNIENAEVSIGYHCGYVSPIPYISIGEEIEEDVFKQYIEAISNDIINWENIKIRMMEDRGVTYANPEIADGIGLYEKEKGDKWVAGSTLMVNLQKIEKIPAFYNPIGARGEDTFFSTLLEECKVIKVPVYHFHDGFLRYRSIMRGKMPKELKKIYSDSISIEERFFNASMGWIKYKPLLTYITNPENYEEKMKETRQKLENSIPKINSLFQGFSFQRLLDALEEYDINVKKHYKEYLKTNEIWDKIKMNVHGKGENK